MQNQERVQLAIFISGGGTTMAEVIRATRDGRLPYVEVALVVSSSADAGGIQKAYDLGIDDQDVMVVPGSELNKDRDTALQLIRSLERRGIRAIMMCGFLPRMPHEIIEEYKHVIFNQHPGPLDNPRRLGFGGKGMYGLAVHEAVLQFAKMAKRPFATCATIHRVTNEVDGGDMVAVQPVRILPDDTAESLQERVLPVEHNLVIQFLADFTEMGKIQEIHRRAALIRPGEEVFLKMAIAEARHKYPKG